MQLEHHPLTLASGLRVDVARRGRGPALLFLHGYTDSWRSFEPVLQRLPGDVLGIAMSQRGHGDSERPASGYDIARLAADAVELLDAAGLAAATVIGHSMGGLVAQEVAITRPDRVARLVLVSTATTFDNPIVRELAPSFRALTDPIPREHAAEFQASTVHRPIPDELMRTFVDESLKVPAHVWRAALDAQLEFHSDARLSRITAPTRIFWGERDDIVSRDEQERLRDGIRGATLVTYADTGHALHWEHPQRFVDDVIAFVRS